MASFVFSPRSKRWILLFLTGGLIGALLFYAFDVAEGDSFNLYRFLFRILLFGLVSVLSNYIGELVDKRHTVTGKK